MALAGLLFDKDGTLIHFNATWNPAVLEVMRRQSGGDLLILQRLAVALNYDLDSGGFRQGAAFVAGTWDDYGRAWAQALGRVNDKTFEDETNALLNEVCVKVLVPVGDPVHVLAGLRARGLHLGIATNDSELAATAQASALGLTNHLCYIAGYDSGFGPKPGPGMVHGFAEHLNVDVSQIALIGDSVHDMRSARNAGAVAIGVLTGHADAAELAPYADHIIGSIEELPALIARLA